MSASVSGWWDDFQNLFDEKKAPPPSSTKIEDLSRASYPPRSPGSHPHGEEEDCLWPSIPPASRPSIYPPRPRGRRASSRRRAARNWRRASCCPRLTSWAVRCCFAFPFSLLDPSHCLPYNGDESAVAVPD
jgi:hypothetical protein